MREGKLHRLWTKFHDWTRLHPVAIYVIAGVGVVFAASIAAFVLLYQKPEPVEAPKPAAVTKEPAAEAPKFYSTLTGAPVKDEAATKQAATAIMIENSPDARPQSGIKPAGVVYEAIAEGGITRFLAVYQQDKPQLIGPVRSVRLYYVQWAAPYQASIAHIGGSKFGLNEVRNGKYRDIDQFFNASTYWRARDRYAPHNVYTSFTKLDELNNKKNFKTSDIKPFSRKEAEKKDPTATKIDVKISGPTYNSSYLYDPPTNTYKRFQAGAPHNDREAGQITPTNVVVMNVEMKLVMEDGYREQITTTGSGKVTIFRDGAVTTGKWSKKGVNDQITFADEKGDDIPLNRGQTWITAIPNGKGSVTWK